MQESILSKIISDKAKWVAVLQQQQRLSRFQHEIVPRKCNFYKALQGTRPAFILGWMQALPSKRLIRENFNPVDIALVYKNFTSVISTLTDEK